MSHIEILTAQRSRFCGDECYIRQNVYRHYIAKSGFLFVHTFLTKTQIAYFEKIFSCIYLYIIYQLKAKIKTRIGLVQFLHIRLSLRNNTIGKK